MKLISCLFLFSFMQGSSYAQIINFTSDDTSGCSLFCTNFYDLSTNNPTSWLWTFTGGNPSSSTLKNPVNICYAVPDTYAVSLVTNSSMGGNSLSIPSYITIFPFPPVPTITQNGFVLTCSPAAHYQWQFAFIDIPGATNQSYTITQSGYYNCVIHDTIGCWNSAYVYFLVSGMSSPDDETFTIYPNPSNGKFSLQGTHESLSEKLLLTVMNSCGQKIFSKNVDAQDLKKEIDLGEISPGIYFLEIESEKFFREKKIIISN